MRGGNWEKFRKTGRGRIEMAGDFSVIVDLYIWKLLKNYDVDDDDHHHHHSLEALKSTGSIQIVSFSNQ